MHEPDFLGRARSRAVISIGSQHLLPGWGGLADLLPVGLYVCDRDGRITQFNRRAVELWGRSPAPGDSETRFHATCRLYGADGAPLNPADTPMANVLRTGTPLHDKEVWIERPDRTRVAALFNVEPLFDEEGTITGAVNCLHDITELKRANDQLRDAQQSVEDFFENGAVALHIVSADGVIVRANRAELDLLGYERAEYVGRNINEFHADEAAIAEILARLKRGEKLDKCPAKLRAKDGSIKDVLITSSARFRDGKFFNTRCFTIDVSGWRHAEEALRQQDQRLAATYENAFIGIAEVDADGRRLRVNEAACAITGHSREELLRRSIFASTVPEDAEVDRARFKQLVAGKIDRYAIEKRYPGQEKVLWVGVVCSAVRDARGEFLYAVRVFQDVSERKIAEEKLRESEKKLRDLLAGLPAAVYTTDAEGRITFYNQAAVELWGAEPGAGVRWCGSWRLYHADGRPMQHSDCPMAVAIRENRPVRGEEAVAERPDGTRVPFIPYPTPLHDETGKLVGAINMLVDITERKRAEIQQKTLLDELNHRVKNTLATVQSLAAQTIRGTRVPKDVGAAFQSRLIALSKAHDLLTRTHWESADLEQMLRDVVEPYRADGGNNIDIRGERVRLDAQSTLTLTMIFHELATNAAKYGSLSSTAGRLSVSWSVAKNVRPPRLRIDWRESDGPPVTKPARRGFGTKLVERGIVQQLKGSAQIAYDPVGIRCNLEIPLP